MFFIHQVSDFTWNPNEMPIGDTINLLRAQVLAPAVYEAQSWFRRRVSDVIPNLDGANPEQIEELMLLSKPGSPTYHYLSQLLQAA